MKDMTGVFSLIRSAVVGLLISLCFLSPAGKAAALDSEDYQRAATSMENAAARIRMADGAVAQVLDEAMSGKYGELHKWSNLETKMNELGKTLDASLPEISTSAALLMSRDPNVNIPRFELGHPFAGNLEKVSDKLSELIELANVERGKLNKVNANLAKMNDLIYKAERYSMIQMGLDSLPFPDDFTEFGAESTVAVLGLYGGPVGWVAVGGLLLYSSTKLVFKFYENAKSLNDKLKAYTQLRDILLEKKKLHGDNLKILDDGAKELNEIKLVLDKQNTRLNEFKDKIKTAMEAIGLKSLNAQATISNNQLNKAQQNKTQSQAVFNSVPSAWIKFTPRDRGILSILQKAYDEIKSEGTKGYDKAILEKGIKEYEAAKLKPVEGLNKQLLADLQPLKKLEESINAACANNWTEDCRKRLADQVTRPKSILSNAHSKASDEALNKHYYDAVAQVDKREETITTACNAKTDECNKKIENLNATCKPWTKECQQRYESIQATCKAWADECSKRHESEVRKPREYLAKAYSADNALFKAEEDEIVAKALVRAVKMNEYLNSGMQKISSDFMTEYELITTELSALHETRRAKTHRPPFDNFPTFFIASQSHNYNVVTAEKPGDVTSQNQAQYQTLEDWRGPVADSITILTDLVKKEEELFKQFEQAIDSSWNTYVQFAPENMSQKQKPEPWGSDPNRYYGSGFSVSVGGFRYGQIEIKSYGFEASLPAMSMRKELEWFTKFLEAYDKDMPIVEKFLIDDARGMKVARLSSELIDALNVYSFSGDWDKEKDIAGKRFTYQDKRPAPGISPDQSDGARYLEEMKATWELKKADVDEIMKAFNQKSVSNLFYNYTNPFTNRPAIEAMAKIPEKIKLYEDLYAELKSGTGDSGKDLPVIKDFYTSFKSAYESRDDTKIMSFMGDEWEAGDGTTLSDLHENLRRSFGIFDEIRYTLQNFSVKPLQTGKYAVSYDVVITSRIYDGNLKHEEKSSVNEEVTIDASGKPRISRTLSGRFWYVE